jgi:tol-pal system beta propeller repeat protein TolB
MAIAVLHGCGDWSGVASAVIGSQATARDTRAVPATLAGKLVFVRAADGRNTLMAMNPDGSGMVSIGVEGSKPHVSPDGTRVAYTTARDEIAVLDLSTGTESVVTREQSMVPRWSPDGGSILFFSARSGRNELWVMNADGTEPRQLTHGGGESMEGDWSPDGTRIVFRRNSGDGGDIWIMNQDGSVAALLHAGERMDSDPRWSPDGRRIAFVSLVPVEGEARLTSEIFVIEANGSGLLQLTRGGENWSPAWAPDGSRIAFFGYGARAEPDLFTVRPDGSDLRLLMGGPTYDHGPAYGPVGTTTTGAAP